MRTYWTLASLLLLLAACGAEEGSGKGVHRFDFAGERHTQRVTLHPRVLAALPSGTAQDRSPVDLVLRNESRIHLGVTGNGTRSVAFVGNGGAAMFKTVCACDSLQALQKVLKDSSVYFSPQLRSEEAVPGTVFLARIDRDRKRIAMARILIVSVGDTTLELRISTDPDWSTD